MDYAPFLRAFDLCNEQNRGFDVVIITAPSSDHCRFWKERLQQQRQRLFSQETMLLIVEEAWASAGAGNGLGTLYAYQEACRLAEELHGVALSRWLAEGAACAIYHTAGKGTRLVPLSASEQFNKPAVLLPSGYHPPLTLLEAVLRQTRPFAGALGGRLSVFWGDQLFIPSLFPLEPPKQAIQLLAKAISVPESQQQWEESSLSDYGVLATRTDGRVVPLDKIDWELFSHQKREGIAKLAVSFGCFTVSLELLQLLQKEFQEELVSRSVLMDSDPYFWMAMTLEEPLYQKLMARRGVRAASAALHWRRMQSLFQLLKHRTSEEHPFGVLEVGEESVWWDFGNTAEYYKNSLALLRHTEEAFAMRHLLGFTKEDPLAGGCAIGSNLSLRKQEESLIAHSSIRSGTVEQSVVTGLRTDHAILKEAVVTSVELPELRATGALLYRTKQAEPLLLVRGEVRSDCLVSVTGESLPFCSDLSFDGKKLWKERLPGNAMSWEELYTVSAAAAELQPDKQKNSLWGAERSERPHTLSHAKSAT